MVYRKGELSKGTMDRQWPHQVALLAARCSGHNYVTVRLFCEGLSLCPRTHSFRRDDADMLVFCFADRAHANSSATASAANSSIPSPAPSGPA